MIFLIGIYGVWLLTILVLWSIGRLALFFLKLNTTPANNFFSQLFYELVMGFTAVAVLRSFFGAGFKTINVLFLLPVVLMIVERVRSKKNVFYLKCEWLKPLRISKWHLSLAVAGTLIFGLNASYLFSISDSFKIPSEDLFFYNKLSHSLAIYGGENLLFSANDNIFGGKGNIVLYHYFDLWFNAIYIDLGIYSSYISLYFITIPVLVFIFYLGILSIWEQVGNLSPVKILFAVLLVFICGMTWEFYNNFVYMKNSMPLFTNTAAFSIYGRKLVVVSVFSAFVFSLFLAGKKNAAIQVFLITTIVYSSGTFIGILGSMLLWLGLALVFFKRFYPLFFIEKRTLNFVFAFLVSFIVFAWFGRQNQVYSSFNEQSLLHLVSPAQYWQSIKSASAVVLYAVLFFGFCYGIYTPFIWINFEKVKTLYNRLAQLLLLIFIALLVGLFALFVFYTNLNARQFFTNMLPFVNVMCLLLVIFSFEKCLCIWRANRASWKATAGIFLLIFIISKNLWFSFSSQEYTSLDSKYGINFTKQAHDLLRPFSNKGLIGYVSAKKSRQYNYPLFEKWTFLDIWGYDNLIEIPGKRNVQEENKHLFAASIFKNLFTPGISEDAAQLNFIRYAKIKVIVADTTLSFLPASFIKAKATDTLSNESLYILKDEIFENRKVTKDVTMKF